MSKSPAKAKARKSRSAKAKSRKSAKAKSNDKVMDGGILAEVIRSAIKKAQSGKDGLSRYRIAANAKVGQIHLDRFMDHGKNLTLSTASKIIAGLGLKPTLS